jgi:Mesyanzhinovviridae DNA helicase
MTYRSPNSPMEHQTSGLMKLARRPSSPTSADVFAWLMEMGTGKTYVNLVEWQAMVDAKEMDSLVVVAPAGAYRNWYLDKSDAQQSEINAHLDPALREKMLVAGWVSGGGAEQRRRLERVLRARGRPRALFVNVEALSTDSGAAEAIRAMQGRGTMMVVDESTTIKSHDANRAVACVRLGEKMGARRIMTGLVTPKSPLDLFMQFYFLDWRILGHQSWINFQNRYAVVVKQQFPGARWPARVVKGYKNVGELQELIAPYSYRVLKEDCLDLAPKTYQPREVELTKEQRRVYGEIKEFASSQLGESSYVTATAVITQLIRMHQVVCGHVVDDDTKQIVDIPSNRVKAILEVLAEHEGKAIIWCTYHHELRKIVSALEKEYWPGAAAQFHGGNLRTRGEDEQRFLGDSKCPFMVATQAAGGRGNTWTVADLSIYAANSYDLEMRSQSEDRNHRRGQTKPVTYVDIIARGTVEERIIRALRQKIDLATAITGENYREWLV